MSRPLPRPFEFPWGKGLIVEEVAWRGRHHEPAIQLLRFDDGLEVLRFASYTLQGRFERSPMLAGHDEIDGLRQSIDEAPIVAQLIRRLGRGRAAP
jgi:hypothetical protein